tara:strand:+ start:124 stop:1239 length:1116 start_codon:yes stop_codon:yes gene_type:complete
MTKKINNISADDILNIIKFNFIKILVATLILSSIPIYLSIKNYTNKNFLITYNYETSPLSRFDLREVNKALNQNYENNLFDQLRQKLEYFHTEYLTGNKETFNFDKGNNNSIMFIDNYFFTDAFKGSKFIQNNNFQIEVFSDDNKEEFHFTLILKKIINDKNIVNLNKLDIDLTSHINQQVIKAINEIILDAKSKYDLQKNEVLESINMSNELIAKSYYFNLKNEISDLQEKLEVIELVDSVPTSDIQWNLPENSTTNLYVSILLGSDALKKQIEINLKKLNETYESLPQIYSNNQLIELVNHDAFISKITINNATLNNTYTEFFKLYDRSFSNVSISFELALLYSLLSIIISFIISLIFFIFAQSLKQKN